ncbi:MAG: hypothetical protein ABSA10_10180 [Anaerolineales bacterium]
MSTGVDVAEGIAAAIVEVLEAAGARPDDANGVTGSTGGVFRAPGAQAVKKKTIRNGSVLIGDTIPFRFLITGL